MNNERIKTIISSFWMISSLIAVIFGAYFFRNIWMLVLLSFIFASALYPGVKFAKKYKIPTVASILSLYILLFAVLSLLLSFIIPPLAQQTTQLTMVISQLFGLDSIHIDGLWRLDLDNLRDLANAYDDYSSLVNQFTGSLMAAISILSSTFSVMFVFVTWLVMTSHILLSLDHFAASFAWILPDKTDEKKATRARALLDVIMQRLGSWMRGQLVLMLVIGVVSYFGLLLLDIPYALPLAIIAGLLEIVPNLGPTLSAVPAIVIAFFFVNPVMAIATAVFYFLVQLVENSLLVPHVMKEAVDVHPLTTLVLMLVGFEAMGVIGAVSILPIYIVVRTLSQELFPDRGPFSSLEKFLNT